MKIEKSNIRSKIDDLQICRLSDKTILNLSFKGNVGKDERARDYRKKIEKQFSPALRKNHDVDFIEKKNQVKWTK